MASNNNSDKQFVPIELFNKLELKLNKKDESIKKYQELLLDYKEKLVLLDQSLISTKKISSEFNNLYSEIKNRECRSCRELSNKLLLLTNELKDKEFTTRDTTVIIKQNKELNMRKIEEMEMHYKEIIGQFDLLISKYTILKEENISLKSEQEIIKENNKGLNSKLIKKTEENIFLFSEIKKLKASLERSKEIDFCLIESSVKNCFMLAKKPNNDSGSNVNTDNINNQTNSNNVQMQYDGLGNLNHIQCEPIPSLLRFVSSSIGNGKKKLSHVRLSKGDGETNNSLMNTNNQ